MKLLCIILFAFAAVVARGATVTGKVTDLLDESGIAGVTVTAVTAEKKTGPTTKTLGNGTYTLTVVPGVYELRYEMPQYQKRPTIVENVNATEAKPLVQDVELLKEGAGQAYYGKIFAIMTKQQLGFTSRLELLYHSMAKEDQRHIDVVVQQVSNAQWP